MSTVIEIENLWKEYRLGVIGHGTLSHDLQSWWARIRRKEDPNSKVPQFNMPIEKVEGDRFWALQDVNIEIKDGTVLGIIGANGAGKSTLLKILSRVTAPTRGSIKVRGRMASLLEVGTGFHPELTGRENIFMNGAILGMAKREISSKIDEIIDFSGVELFIDTPVKRYSSGMKVRLGFAVAAHLEPEILVVDEVLAVGDVDFQKKCLGKMDQIRGEGRTILFVSHNMSSVENLCTEVTIFKDGVLTNQGPAGKMIDSYLSEMNDNGSKENSFIERENIHVNSNAWLKKITMTVDGKESSTIRSGQNLEFVIDYDANNKVKECDLSVGIYDNYGQKIIHAGTVYSNKKIKIDGEGKVVFVLEETPLPAGNYYANFSLQVNSEPTDWVKRAINFLVEQGDFYRTGKVPSISETKILAKYSWNIN